MDSRVGFKEKLLLDEGWKIRRNEANNMEIIITIGIIIIAITCLSIEGKLKKTSEQNKEIIELLKQGK